MVFYIEQVENGYIVSSESDEIGTARVFYTWNEAAHFLAGFFADPVQGVH